MGPSLQFPNNGSHPFVEGSARARGLVDKIAVTRKVVVKPISKNVKSKLTCWVVMAYPAILAIRSANRHTAARASGGLTI